MREEKEGKGCYKAKKKTPTAREKFRSSYTMNVYERLRGERERGEQELIVVRAKREMRMPATSFFPRTLLPRLVPGMMATIQHACR